MMNLKDKIIDDAQLDNVLGGRTLDGMNSNVRLWSSAEKDELNQNRDPKFQGVDGVIRNNSGNIVGA